MKFRLFFINIDAALKRHQELVNGTVRLDTDEKMIAYDDPYDRANILFTRHYGSATGTYLNLSQDFTNAMVSRDWLKPLSLAEGYIGDFNYKNAKGEYTLARALYLGCAVSGSSIDSSLSLKAFNGRSWAVALATAKASKKLNEAVDAFKLVDNFVNATLGSYENPYLSNRAYSNVNFDFTAGTKIPLSETITLDAKIKQSSFADLLNQTDKQFIIQGLDCMDLAAKLSDAAKKDARSFVEKVSNISAAPMLAASAPVAGARMLSTEQKIATKPLSAERVKITNILDRLDAAKKP